MSFSDYKGKHPNTPLFPESLRQRLSDNWNKEKREAKSKWLQSQWANPNSIYNDADFLKSRTRCGENSHFYGVRHFSKDNPMYGKRGENSPFYGKPRPESVKVAVREMILQRAANGESAWNKDLTKETDERLQRQSESLKRLYADTSSTYNSLEHIEKMNKIFWTFINSRKGSKYNATEQALHQIIELVAPSQYKYNGAGELGFRIYRHLPDFVNVNGQKKLIELNGCYWHCCPTCGIEKTKFGNANDIRERDNRYIQQAQALGFEVLVVWQHELRNTPALIERIKSFNAKEYYH